ncbi:oxidoreductase, zinc-binding dehydrogenase family, putative [Metarhizium acridum CQMa 102]|uniref:Oxidoreductase, zinc-binding dehydrogenase family, putative n=1 Tax=Metarhizium acridum (strain CQMa 102) TaxID=655827 RepID=E9DX39_METAQ|nr:oxidoreductase, zinc-binding dehydrogenase family, putative [Metarhizium acridum CQMa 102]EFY91902.1 oxidoreductase, zinc-binding dehydrogenase family, putative [Metarhizium acridum CQMa 102]
MGNVAQGPDEVDMADIPPSQTVLLLRAPRQGYHLVDEYPVPRLAHESEILVRNRAIGLNPIDWKAPDFGFGLPQLPYIAGRELAGVVAQVSPGNTKWKVGDRVAVISTDYRDPRKAAYQQFVVAQGHTVVRLPAHISYEQGSAFGVAFAAASLALGVSLGADFSAVLDGPDLYRAVRGLAPGTLPPDVAAECLDGLEPDERPGAGDWLGGCKWGRFGDFCKPRDPAGEARRAPGGRGRGQRQTRPLAVTPSRPKRRRGHLVGLAGLPKGYEGDDVLLHTLPIKLFHEVEAIGDALVAWAANLLDKRLLVPPDIVDIEYGLNNVNAGLDRMRNGEISGGKLVVKV